MSECHLGDLCAALADNELCHDQRDRALSHIAACGTCRAEVEAQRRLKALLANQADPEISVELTVRLFAVAAAPPNRPLHNDVVRVKVRRSMRSRAATYSVMGVALVAGVVAAGGEHDGRKVRPPVSAYVEEHSATTDQLGPLQDPAGNIVLASIP